MRSESIVLAVAGICFGVILGWVIGVQQASLRPGPRFVGSSAVPAGEGTGSARQAPPLDEGRVQSLMTVIKSDPKNVGAVVQLANTYFDAERYIDAITWYEASFQLDPTSPDVSTDLGISYYYTGQTDRALQQFEQSLKLDPRHTKTMLHQGIVLAFGKQDLAGAETAWKRVVASAPESAEGKAASRALEGIKAPGHAVGAPTPGS